MSRIVLAYRIRSLNRNSSMRYSYIGLLLISISSLLWLRCHSRININTWGTNIHHQSRDIKPHVIRHSILLRSASAVNTTICKHEFPEQSILSGEPKEDKAGQGSVGENRTAEHWHGSGDCWRRVRRFLHRWRNWTSANFGMKGKYYPGLLLRKPATRMGTLYPLRMDPSIWSAQIDGYFHYDYHNIVLVIILSLGCRTR